MCHVFVNYDTKTGAIDLLSYKYFNVAKLTALLFSILLKKTLKNYVTKIRSEVYVHTHASRCDTC